MKHAPARRSSRIKPDTFAIAAACAASHTSTIPMGATNSQRAFLVAPCGMDCGICSAYLAYANDIPTKRAAITHCAGCRVRPKHCAYLKSHCVQLSQGEVEFCFQCAEYPCAHLEHIDQRYRTTYGMSLIENLEVIQSSGMAAFLARQQLQFACPRCGALRSVHNGKCFSCEPVRHWRDG